jgi:diaminopimelate epimerase
LCSFPVFCFLETGSLTQDSREKCSMDFPIPFAKMSGAGNDFIIIDNRLGIITVDEMTELAIRACRRGKSVGADGLVLLENDEELDFAWKFYNSDGSVAEMCGNAARCAARIAYLDGISGPDMCFRTLAGPIRATVKDSTVRVQLTRPRDLVPSLPLTLAGGREITAGFVNTGVPHTIISVPQDYLRGINVSEMGREIRFHPRFAPAGTNANFVSVIDPHTIDVRTYERGVEAETLACGTGAAAVALMTTVWNLTSPPVAVMTRGGDRLLIHPDPSDPGHGDIFMEGIASLVYRGQLTGETIRGG